MPSGIFIRTKEHNENLAKSLRGRKWTSEQRKRHGENRKRLIAEGKIIQNKFPYYKGENHPRWKGGVTPKNKLIRNSKEMSEWRKAVFKRDNYTCQDCRIRCEVGTGRVTIHAHHIKPFAYFPELRFELSNGKTLCVNCHSKIDKHPKNLARTYGNTKQRTLFEYKS